MSLRSRVMNVFRRERVDDALREELEFHLEQRAAANVRKGMSAVEADRAARRRLGNELLLRERSRDVKLLPWLESLLRDAQFGARMLRKHAVLTAATVLSLSLAIGACAAAFSLIDALMLRPLPVRSPRQLFYLAYPTEGQGGVPGEATSFNYPLYKRMRDAGAKYSDLFAMSYSGPAPANLSGGSNDDEKVFRQFVSGNAFPALGVDTARGRLIGPSDDEAPGKHPVAVISYGLWKRRFGMDPNVIGRWIHIEERQFQIIGVMQRGFTGVEPGTMTDIWLPVKMYDAKALESGGHYWFRTWGRLEPGIQPQQVQAVLQPVFYNFRRERAQLLPPDRPQKIVDQYLSADIRVKPAASGMSFLRQTFERPLWILTLVVGLVLLIACANVACLYVGRAAAREREMALRISIGAGRRRLVQQMAVECAVVTAAACSLAALFARAAAPVIVRMISRSDVPVRLDLQYDWRLLAFLIAVGGVVTFLFGVAPAVRASRVAPVDALKSGGPKHTVRTGIFRYLVAAQVAFSFVVLFLAGIFVQSFARLSRVDLGFDPNHLVVVSVNAKDLRNANTKALAVWNQVRERVGELPKVESASYSTWSLFTNNTWSESVRVPGKPVESADTWYLPVSPRFFETMRMRLIAGRDFTPREAVAELPTAAVINEAFRNLHFPGEDPIGQRFFRIGDGNKLIAQDIVGVVSNARYTDLKQPVPPTVYVPMGPFAGVTLQVRTTADASAIANVLRTELPRIHPALTISQVSTQSELIQDTILRERVLAVLSGFFAVVAMLLAGVGLYGVLSYIVVQRTREIGIRVALGARPSSVARSLLTNIGLLAAVGIAAGAVSGIMAARWFTTMLFQVKPWDATSIALPLGVLLVSCSAAAVIPALRAMRVDPVIALRYE